MTKLLILGCSHAELPLIEAARSRGCFVGVVGNDPDGLGMRIADAKHVIDYSDVDAVREVILRDDYRALVAGCNDFAELTRVRLEADRPTRVSDKQLQAEAVHFKDRFRRLCASLQIQAPRAVTLSAQGQRRDELDSLHFPVIVKPTDLTGGKGMRVCSDRADLDAAVDYALGRSRRDQVIVEEFLNGQLRSACFWQSDGRMHLLTHADEFMYLNPFLVAAAIAPSASSPGVLESITRDLERISAALELTDGVFHVQYLSEGSSYAILEVCRRPPGDLYIKLPTSIASVSLADLIIDQALGFATKIPSIVTELRPTIRICVMPPKNGVITSWGIVPSLRDIAHEVLELKSTQCEIADFMTEKLAIVLASHDDRRVLEELTIDPAQTLDVIYIS